MEFLGFGGTPSVGGEGQREGAASASVPGRKVAAVVVALLVLTAGCSGIGAENSDTPPSPTTPTETERTTETTTTTPTTVDPEGDLDGDGVDNSIEQEYDLLNMSAAEPQVVVDTVLALQDESPAHVGMYLETVLDDGNFSNTEANFSDILLMLDFHSRHSVLEDATADGVSEEDVENLTRIISLLDPKADVVENETVYSGLSIYGMDTKEAALEILGVGTHPESDFIYNLFRESGPELNNSEVKFLRNLEDGKQVRSWVKQQLEAMNASNKSVEELERETRDQDGDDLMRGVEIKIGSSIDEKDTDGDHYYDLAEWRSPHLEADDRELVVELAHEPGVNFGQGDIEAVDEWINEEMGWDAIFVMSGTGEDYDKISGQQIPGHVTEYPGEEERDLTKPALFYYVLDEDTLIGGNEEAAGVAYDYHSMGYEERSAMVHELLHTLGLEHRDKRGVNIMLPYAIAFDLEDLSIEKDQLEKIETEGSVVDSTDLDSEGRVLNPVDKNETTDVDWID